MEYPLLAVQHSQSVNKIFISTDDDEIMKLGQKHGAEIIIRPLELASKTALGEDAFLHGYKVIKEKVQPEKMELIVLLFCNAPTITAITIDRGIEMLRNDPNADSAITVSAYNMWSPLRARRENKQGYLDPFVPFETFGDPKTLNCDRDSQGEVLFADMSVSIVRPWCLENLGSGLLPQKWMGQKILPIKQWGGLDVDFEWQIPQVEFWLKKNGFSESATPYARHQRERIYD